MEAQKIQGMLYVPQLPSVTAMGAVVFYCTNKRGEKSELSKQN